MERIIEPTRVMVVVDTPLICMIDGVQAQHFSGTGVVVYHSETMRIVLVDRYTVPVSISDASSTNILMDDKLNARVSDYGLSRLTGTELSHISTCAHRTSGLFLWVVYLSITCFYVLELYLQLRV